VCFSGYLSSIHTSTSTFPVSLMGPLDTFKVPSLGNLEGRQGAGHETRRASTAAREMCEVGIGVAWQSVRAVLFVR
jgi:hypothetical protein